MKNQLDFNIQYSYLEALNFIQRFTSAYVFLESSANPAAFADDETREFCVGCSSGGKQHSCKHDVLADTRCGYFYLFNTMCGNSSLRCRFDGEPTEMQKLIGDTAETAKSCGSDFTIDFLFGYAGYAYRKVTDNFKAEIIASIDAGKPVIAKIKAGNAMQNGTTLFRLITGYDGDSLLCPEYWGPCFDGEQKLEEPPVYSEFDALYIFGEKITPRYTLKDGLENIRRAMECNLDEKTWQGYLAKLEVFPEASANERKALAKRVNESNLYAYNSCGTNMLFSRCAQQHLEADQRNGKMRRHDLFKELYVPAFDALWGEIGSLCCAIVDNGHTMGGFYRGMKWPWQMRGISTEICEAIAKIKQADVELLDLVKQAIAILEQ